jgi:hypothetical protein
MIEHDVIAPVNSYAQSCDPLASRPHSATLSEHTIRLLLSNLLHSTHKQQQHVPGEKWSPGWPAHIRCAGLLLIRYEQTYHACCVCASGSMLFIAARTMHLAQKAWVGTSP